MNFATISQLFPNVQVGDFVQIGATILDYSTIGHGPGAMTGWYLGSALSNHYGVAQGTTLIYVSGGNSTTFTTPSTGQYTPGWTWPSQSGGQPPAGNNQPPAGGPPITHPPLVKGTSSSSSTTLWIVGGLAALGVLHLLVRK